MQLLCATGWGGVDNLIPPRRTAWFRAQPTGTNSPYALPSIAVAYLVEELWFTANQLFGRI